MANKVNAIRLSHMNSLKSFRQFYFNVSAHDDDDDDVDADDAITC